MTTSNPQPSGGSTTHTRRSLINARISVSVAFLISGLAIGTWVSRIPAVQEHIGLSTGALGLAFLGSTLGNLVAMPGTAVISTRTGTRPLNLVGVLLICLTMPIPALANSGWALGLALFVYGVAIGVIEVAMNAQAVLVENAWSKPIMSSFHGVWSVGGMLGAAAGGLAAKYNLTPLAHFSIAAAFLAVLGVVSYNGLYHDSPKELDEHVTEPAFGLPLKALVGVGMFCFCAMLAEGAMADWSAIYLKQIIGTSAALAAIGYSAFAMSMAFLRFCGDSMNARLGPVAIARIGGLVAAAGMLTALLAGHPWAVIAGFGLVGAGLAVTVPLAYTAAGNTPGVSPAAAVASVATTGFCGFLAGPAVIGFAAEAVGLRNALGMVLVLCLGIVTLSNTVAPRRS